MASPRNRLAGMKPSGIALLMAEAQGWRPETGSELEGIVVGVKIAENQINGSLYPIVVVLPDDGSDPIAVHGFQSVLASEFRTYRPVKGDAIYIKCLGPKENWQGPKGYSAPIMYAVNVEKPGRQAPDPWATLDGGRAAKPAPPEQDAFSEPAPF